MAARTTGVSGGVLAAPAMATAAQMISDHGESMVTGRRLGVYHLQTPLGAGGMGEVYRARDTKLGRDVAIKVLPKIFTSDPERLARFASLKQHFEAVRQHEVKRVRGRLGKLSSGQENAIESLTHCIIDQILETPITVLKAASDDSDSPAVIKTVHRVFSLSWPW